MTVTPNSLDIAYTRSKDFPSSQSADEVILLIGCLPFMQLDQDSFSSGEAALPGLDVKLSGSAVQYGTRKMTFNKTTKPHGAYYYELKYSLAPDLRDSMEPRILIEVKKTVPPTSDLIM